MVSNLKYAVYPMSTQNPTGHPQNMVCAPSACPRVVQTPSQRKCTLRLFPFQTPGLFLKDLCFGSVFPQGRHTCFTNTGILFSVVCSKKGSVGFSSLFWATHNLPGKWGRKGKGREGRRDGGGKGKEEKGGERSGGKNRSIDFGTDGKEQMPEKTSNHQ